jgi:hypothetical protein
MAADDSGVRLVVTTDWDAGFQLTPEAKPLDDVPPGGEYVVECSSAGDVMLDGVVVRDFAFDRLYVLDPFGKKFASIMPERGVFMAGTTNDRLYYLKPAVAVAAGDSVRPVLKNLSDAPKKPKVAMIVRSDQDVAAAAPPGWRVEGVHVGKVAQPLAPSCPTCGTPDHDVRRQLAGDGDDEGSFCSDAWHGVGARKVAVHAPKLARTLYDGPGNATLVNGCSCGAEAPNARAFADHVGVPENAVVAMLALVSIIYDFYDRPTTMTREDVARRVARCLEFQQMADALSKEDRTP